MAEDIFENMLAKMDITQRQQAVLRASMELFATQGMHTAAIAGIMAVGILLGSTMFRMYSEWKFRKLFHK